MFTLFFLYLFTKFNINYNFQQKIEIDTSLHVLESTPMYMTSEDALKGHIDFENRLKEERIDLKNDYYLIFRYRDKAFILLWIKLISENRNNPLLIVWFVNAIEQMGNPENLKYVSVFKNSSNGIIRECVANAYGFLAKEDSILVLQKWLSEEKNGYVCKTIVASIDAIRKGGYRNRIPYLPKYFKEKPLKLDYLYNVKVNDDSSMQYSETDTSDNLFKGKNFIYPTLQYLWKIKGSPKRGFFGSKSGNIYHIGVDACWLLEGLPVHSISDGIVKQISHNLSWGNLVVVESLTPEGDTISVIYGHLSPFNNLCVGDTIYRGDRIGQIGNSVTPDNGGYWAHLHLGIEKSPYFKADIAGYDSDTTAYENPLIYIKKHEKP